VVHSVGAHVARVLARGLVDGDRSVELARIAWNGDARFVVLPVAVEMKRSEARQLPPLRRR
jgi:hypothetical protein